MVQKVSPAIPVRNFSSVILQNRIVRVALLVLAAYVVYRVVKSLWARGTPPPATQQPSSQVTSKSSPAALSTSDTIALRLVDEGIALFDEGEFDQALQKFQAAEALNPRNVEVNARIWLGQARVYLYQYKLDLAMQQTNPVLLQQNLSRDFRSQAYEVRGEIYFKQKKYPEAISNFTYALQLNPPELDRIVIQLKICRVFCELGEFENSLKKCRETLKNVQIKDEAISEELVELAESCQEINRPKEALEYIEAAEKAESSSKSYTLGLKAQILSMLNRDDESLGVLKSAFAALPADNPDLTSWLYELQGDSYRNKGDKPAAIQSFQEALKFSQDEEDRQEIQAEIQKLQSSS